jgi:hypothetical protein
VVEADAELTEIPLGRRRCMLVQADERPADHVHGVVKIRVRVLIEDRTATKEPLVPRNTH